jgi:hypothetical protein
MEKNLPVPYKSEEDADAVASNLDCGPTSLSMVLNFYGEHTTTDQLTGLLVNRGLITFPELQKIATSFGYNAEYYLNQTFDALKKMLDQNIPIVVLLHAGDLQSRQDKNWTGGHFVTVVGYRADDSLYVNDPDFYGQYRAQGDHHVYTLNEFMQAWGDCHIDGNQDFSFMVVFPKTDTTKLVPKQVKITSTVGVRARTNPSINTANIVKVYKVGTVLDVIDQVTGDDVSGNNQWYQIKDTPSVFIWSGGAAIISATTPTVLDVNNNVQVPDSEMLDALIVVYQTAKEVLESQNALPKAPPTGFWAKVKEALNLL